MDLPTNYLAAKKKVKAQPRKHLQDAEDTWRMLGDEKYKDRYWRIFKQAQTYHLIGELLELRNLAITKNNPGAYFIKAANNILKGIKPQ